MVVNYEKYAAMFYLLLVRCLLDNILRIWERSVISLTSNKTKSEQVNNLTPLMSFIKAEQTVLSVSKTKAIEVIRNALVPGGGGTTDLPTVKGLLNCNQVNNKMLNCLFSEKKRHSHKCNKAKNMSIETKRQIAK